MAAKLFVDTNVLVYANNSLSPLCAPAGARLFKSRASYSVGCADSF